MTVDELETRRDVHFVALHKYLERAASPRRPDPAPVARLGPRVGIVVFQADQLVGAMGTIIEAVATALRTASRPGR
jgi:hypothetical protein